MRCFPFSLSHEVAAMQSAFHALRTSLYGCETIHVRSEMGFSSSSRAALHKKMLYLGPF